MHRAVVPLLVAATLLVGGFQIAKSPDSTEFALSREVGTLAVVLPSDLTPDLSEHLEGAAQRFFGDKAEVDTTPRDYNPPRRFLKGLSAFKERTKQFIKARSRALRLKLPPPDEPSYSGTELMLHAPPSNPMEAFQGQEATASIFSGLACAFKVVDRRAPSPTKIATCLGWLSLTLIESSQSEYGVVLVQAFEPRSPLERTAVAALLLSILFLVWQYWPSKAEHGSDAHCPSKTSSSAPDAETSSNQQAHPAAASVQNAEQLCGGSDPILSQQLVVSGAPVGKGSSGASEMFLGQIGEVAVAVKCVSDAARAHQELQVLLQAGSHQHVARLVTHHTEANLTRIVLTSFCSQSLEEFVEGDSSFKLRAAEPAEVAERTDHVRQLISGVRHLHSRQLVHTKLSPATIRLSAEQQHLQICSLGSCVRTDQPPQPLPHPVQSLWSVPPEQLTEHPPPVDTSLDVFSVGCLVYYLCTHGAHPFGKRSVRMQRSARADAGLPGLLAKAPLAADLVGCALKPSTVERASIVSLAEHPALWSLGRVSQFLCDLSDRLDSEPSGSVLCARVDSGSSRVGGKDWSKRLDDWMKEDLFRRRGYRVSSLQDLLRAVRNKTRHCLTLPAEAQGVIEPTAASVAQYFVTKFPKLVLETVRLSSGC